MKFFIFILLISSNTALSKSLLPTVQPGKPLPSNLFVELNKVINPAVVNISTKTNPKIFSNRQRGRYQDPMEDLLRQFFGGPGAMMKPSKPSHSLGTGFIIRKDGLILTNNHVINKADIIDVQLSEKDDKTYRAKVIGRDPRTDIALIKIEAKKNLPVAKLGISKNLQVGEWVAAFGNPFGHGHTMTKGIISAIGRNLDEINLLPFIQTDASINPGNSGGPLVNMKGEVIAVNTAIDARAQGIGFAIPIDEVKNLIKQLESTGTVARGFLGVEMDSMNKEYAKHLNITQETGALIINVLPGSPADKAGLKPYDIIVRFNSSKVKTSSDLIRAVARTANGDKGSLQILRGGKIKTLKVRVGQNNTKSLQARSSKNRYNTKPNSKQQNPLLNDYGLEISDVTKQLKRDFELKGTGRHKALVTRIISYSKASMSGLRAGDLIYEINRKPIFNAKSAKKIFTSSNKSTFLIRAKRGSSFILARIKK